MQRDLNPAERRDWLRLWRSENVGAVTFDHLIRRYGDAASALAAVPELARRGGRANPRIYSIDEAEREIEAGEALGAQLIASCETAFPPLLAAVDPPPPIIWARGNAELLSRPCVALVGARIASAAGQRFARTLAQDLGAAGYVVVSGLARGVDGSAHEGGMAGGTVAVVGGGVDDIYPPEHGRLYDEIVARGCVISESPVGAAAQARDFPRRNRLISGLSLAVVVVEAELRSGSLITARLAGEQGREVLAVPGSPLDPRAKGTNDLLRQGAAICEGVEDVLRAIEAMSSVREPARNGYDPEAMEAFEQDAAFEALRERIDALLSPTPTPRDELVRLSGAPAPMVYAVLTELALAGRAELLPGGLAAKG
jgi:DNA processing protein